MPSASPMEVRAIDIFSLEAAALRGGGGRDGVVQRIPPVARGTENSKLIDGWDSYCVEDWGTVADTVL